MRHFTEYPPLTLYIHSPWCIKKCPYCDFNSHAVKDTIPEREYIDALVADLEQHAPDIWNRPVESIFFGGGTPSLLSASGIERLLGQIRALTRLEPTAEITLEANPGTVEQSRFRQYREIGINRLSVGVQSFNDKHLEILGRVHNADNATTAIETVKLAGFDNFNVDLMHGLPQQTVEEALNDVRCAVELQAPHLSYYQLTIEPNTLFAANPPTLPNEEVQFEIQDKCKALIADSGLHQYEVSAYARNTRQRCHHNLNYWLFGDYLGIGAGAHSKLSFPAYNSIVRHSKPRHPTEYMKAASTADRIRGSTELDSANARLEFLMNALRLNEGFQIRDFEARTGEPISVVLHELQALEQEGLILRDLQTIKTTSQGATYLDSVLQRFLVEPKSKPVIPLVPER